MTDREGNAYMTVFRCYNNLTSGVEKALSRMMGLPLSKEEGGVQHSGEPGEEANTAEDGNVGVG